MDGFKQKYLTFTQKYALICSFSIFKTKGELCRKLVDFLADI